MFKPATIPVPSYAFDDDELVALRAKIVEIDGEADEPCERAAACMVAIDTELAKRAKPITI